MAQLPLFCIWVGKKTKPTNGCNIQYVVPWEQRINKCSASSREQWFRAINSMTPPPHFSLAHGYTLQQGVGRVTGCRGEGLEMFLKWPVKPSWLQKSPYIIFCLCNHVYLCKVVDGRGWAKIWHWPEENHQTHVLLEAWFELMVRDHLLKTLPATRSQLIPSSPHPHKVRTWGLY